MRSAEEVVEVADRVVSILNRSGIHVEKGEVFFENVVAVDALQLGTTLERLVYSLDILKAMYEPEQFPSLIYKDWYATFLLFSSGKVVMTGIKNEEEVKKMFQRFKKVIKESH